MFLALYLLPEAQQGYHRRAYIQRQISETEEFLIQELDVLEHDTQQTATRIVLPPAMYDDAPVDNVFQPNLSLVCVSHLIPLDMILNHILQPNILSNKNRHDNFCVTTFSTLTNSHSMDSYLSRGRSFDNVSMCLEKL